MEYEGSIAGRAGGEALETSRGREAKRESRGGSRVRAGDLSRWGVGGIEGRTGEKEAVGYRTGEWESPGRRCPVWALLNQSDGRESKGPSSVKGRKVELSQGPWS